MKDLSLPEAFEELSTNELESVEGGFIFTTLLGTAVTLTRGISGTMEAAAPVAQLLDRKTEALHGIVSEVTGFFRRNW